MPENIILIVIWILALAMLILLYVGIQSVISACVDAVRDYIGYERYRDAHPYDWKRNGL